MESVKKLFNNLWKDYIGRNPIAGEIHNLFVNEGEVVINDHVAFRTFDHPKVNIDVLAQWFKSVGYVEKGEYHFEEKKLFAKHFEHPEMKDAPRVFISQLKTEEFSNYLQQTVNDIVSAIPENSLQSASVLTAGNLWDKSPSYEIYYKLREESEYAAWLYLYGFTVNHFTVSVNHLKKLNTIQKTNSFLKNNGYILNDAGGEIKGTPEQLLEQSSIKASIHSMLFKEGTFDVPVTYYEFARRYPDVNGNLYSGFIAKSADKIFESTNFYKK